MSQRVVASFVAMLCLVSVSSNALGQTAASSLPSVDPQAAPQAQAWLLLPDDQRLSFLAEAVTGRAQLPQQRSSRDSLKNGAIIGAAVGAVALGGLGGFFCKLYQEEGGPSCWPDTLRVAAIGAAIGTGAGLVVDAILTRHTGVMVRVGIRF
jgi:hypothetical protein